MEDEKTKESGYPCLLQLLWYEAFDEILECKDCVESDCPRKE